MTKLDDESILVTGASRGIGRRLAVRFAAEGARVALLARNPDQLREVSREAPGETLVVTADVTDADAVERAVDRVVNEFGRVDTLVNNAGVGLLSLDGKLKPVVDVGVDEWRTVLEVNLTGAFLCAREVLPHMVDQGRGNVINVSSMLGHEAEANWAPYASSKFGLEALTQTMALEHAGDGVNVNSLYPGGRVETAFWDQLPDEERVDIFGPDVLNDAAVLLAAQGPDGVTGESADAATWESRLD